jgi:16S rRNA C967 or C1407 C5-methylase (RsmB/RsmF family)/NOL1/NOP2/fmu family ribosome biogenesis protein
MISLPEQFNTRMQNLLGKAAWNDFADALQQPVSVSIRYNRHKSATPQEAGNVLWCDMGRYLAERPLFTLDPLLHAGAYYVQEASSMFLEQAAALWREQANLRFLDLCAAPGGKSTHLADLLPAGSLLVSNEVIRSRTAALLENLAKWGNPNVVVTHNDPAAFAALPGFFDVMMVDAPCSGEGMFRKDPAAVAAWSEANVKLCAERQRRILSDAWSALKDGGLLLYSTCTYNREENEDNVRWVMQHLGAEMVTLPLPPAWGITTGEYGYRFFPHKTKGEGFFISLLRKTENGERGKGKGKNRYPFSVLHSPSPAWLNGDFTFIRDGDGVQALPGFSVPDVFYLKQRLRLLQAGIKVGEVKGADIIPAAALALSTALRKDAFLYEEVDRDTALRFLRRDAITVTSPTKGYCLIGYQNIPLGFVKNIGLRSNNLYPAAWRIRMHIAG